MSDGGDDLAKAIINRTRSSFGTGLEDLAYMISDFSPGYEPAKTVLKNNTAGSISAKADSQFLKAKEKTGDFGDKLIDVADSSAETLGYSMFGPKAFYAMGTAEGFAEYKKLRMEGYSPEESLFGATKKAGFAIASEKVDDFVGKNNLIDDYLNNQSGVIRKLDSNKVKRYNGEKLSPKEYARLQSAVMTNHPNERGYIMQILDNENGDPAIIYDVYVKDDGTMTIFGRSDGKNIHERKGKYNVNKKRRKSD